MHVLKTLVALAASFTLTTPTPINADHTPNTNVSPRQADDAPRCGYVRMNEGENWMVGVYTRGVCEVIWNEQAASIYRIDAAGCACRFYTSRESCVKLEPVPPRTGPNVEESSFGDTKPKWVKCERN